MAIIFTLFFFCQIFQAVVNLLPARKVETFVVDFEAGMWQGLRDVFEEPQFRGCAFHIGQTLFRKVQEMGLQVNTINSTLPLFNLSQYYSTTSL